MKREFEYEKKIMEKEMQNAIWVDENRKMMLAQQIKVVKNQEDWERDKDLLNREAIMKNQQQLMSNNQNQNPYANQNPNQMGQNTGINNARNQSSQNQNGQNINSSSSITNPNETQKNPYDSYLNNLQQRYSSQQPRKISNQTPQLPLNPQQYSNQNLLNTITNSNQNINPSNQNNQSQNNQSQNYQNQNQNMRPNQ